MAEKKRGARGPARRFTNRQILAIRSDPRMAPAMARRYKCHPSLIRQVRNGLGSYEGGPWPAEMPTWPRGWSGNETPRDMKGEKSPAHLLTDEAVRWLRGQRKMRPHVAYPALAEDVAVRFRLDRVPCERTVGLAITGKTWGHL